MGDKILAKEFIVYDRFNLPMLGTVYSVKGPDGVELYLHDTLYDLKGNRFEIKAFEHILWANERPKNPPLGLLLTEIDGVPVQGDRLAKNMEDFDS